MCREQSTMIPSDKDCPLVPVPPPRGVKLIFWYCSSAESSRTSFKSSVSFGKTTA